MSKPIVIPQPDLQIAFAQALPEIRNQQLQDALLETVRSMEVPAIDRELAELVLSDDLALLASRGLRGELLFAVPCILERNPRLLAYYRLLLGHSQKEFYAARCAGTTFKRMEEQGDLSRLDGQTLAALCAALVSAASWLLAGIGASSLTGGFLDQLTLLTLGAQLRGGANVKKGSDAIRKVFTLLNEIVAANAVTTTERLITIRNAAGRPVLIEFAADPDIVIREKMESGEFRNIIAIEVKGGKDFSNIHNRVGEAEKSHQKARQRGFVECWTVVNVDAIDLAMARRESPATNRFYLLSQLESRSGREFQDFRGRIAALIGIPA